MTAAVCFLLGVSVGVVGMAGPSRGEVQPMPRPRFVESIRVMDTDGLELTVQSVHLPIR